MKTERPPQLLRFEQRNAEGALEHGFQALIEIGQFFATGTPIQIWMHHIALDRSGPNDRDLDHHVVKKFRFHPRQRRHLRLALDLKYTDGVGVLHYLDCLLVVFWDGREIERTRP